jgi:hypothetical protein
MHLPGDFSHRWQVRLGQRTPDDCAVHGCP